MIDVEQNVAVSQEAKTAAEPAAPAPAAPASKQITRQSKAMNKSEFIRKQPSTLAAADVVKRAARSGIKLNANFVHSVRSMAKSRHDKAAGHKTNGHKPNGNGHPKLPEPAIKQKQFDRAVASAVRDSQLGEIAELVKVIGFDRARSVLVAAVREHARELNTWIDRLDTKS